MSPSEQHLFSATHEWTLMNSDDTATIGVSDFAQTSLGDIMHATLPEIGRIVQAGEACCVLESLKTASDVHAPISGTIVSINHALDDTPELINDSPYDQGWLFRIQPDSDLDPSNFLTHQQYSSCC
jgi:glycine cleavage system H protein